MHRRLLLAPVIVLGVLAASGGAPVAAAPRQSTPATVDCGAEANSYPDRWQAEGATFLGRVNAVHTRPDRYPVYRLSVGRVFAGDIGEAITVRISCVETRFRLGERYLISSNRFLPTSGRIDAITFSSGR